MTHKIIAIKDQKFLETIKNYESYFQEEQYSLDVLKNIFKDKNYQIIGIINNKKLISYAIIQVTDVIDLHRIYTLNEYRCKSYAKAIIEWIINNHQKAIFTEVNFKNISAIKFYESLDFKKISVRKRYYQSKDDALILKRSI